MSTNDTAAIKALRGLCPAPFFQVDKFDNTTGFVDGRFCQEAVPGLTCCLPCPLTDWVYPENFNTMSEGANWVSVISAICCIFLLLSYAFLPVDKTSRHYLSISITSAVFIMNLGFIVPLAAKPDQCANEITPNGMSTSSVCGASGTFLLFGGFAGVMWVFLRSVSLHLQICWQVVVGRTFMWFAQASGWLVPVLVVVLSLVFSGVSFRFGATCHINHKNSFADFWVPLLIFAGLTLIIQLVTFGYCIKVYLASLADNSPTTEGSSLPTYSQANSIRTMSPRQAYRRVRRVIQLQWRGICIVLIIICDVIFFSIIFVFQDNTVQAVKTDPDQAKDWTVCLTLAYATGGDKKDCFGDAGALVVSQATIGAVLCLLALNGIWLLFLLGRWSMVTGWIELFKSLTGRGRKNQEFVSVDARYDMKKDQRAYEMLSRDSSAVVTPLTPVKSPASPSIGGMRTPDYFDSFNANANDSSNSRNPNTHPYHSSQQQTARYHAPQSSFSNPRPPTATVGWDPQRTYARSGPNGNEDMNPLAMNRI